MNITGEDEIFAQYGTSYDPVTMMGAGYEDDEKDACRGDSGGPLSVEYETGNGFSKIKQVGIVSWGYECGLIGIYTRVSTYFNWIEQTIAAYKRSVGVK